MNQEAKRIGLGASTFRNSTGLPHAEQSVTARDLARLATTIIRDYPEFYPIYGERAFTWNDITQRNRNPLLTMDIGADGMKTGQTAASGYGLVGSAVQNGQRLIVVINGAESEAQRAEEARKLLEWGFRAFRRVSLFGPEEIVAEAAVFGGREPTVGLRSGEPVSILLPEQRLEEVTARVVYDGPVPAPVAEGQEIASLKIAVGEEVVATAPLFAATGVPSGRVTQRARDGLADLLFGWW
jgi:D-alanyl-D-alanine carboxypeptidase (penicillin-binding protein 5/6)